MALFSRRLDPAAEKARLEAARQAVIDAEHAFTAASLDDDAEVAIQARHSLERAKDMLEIAERRVIAADEQDKEDQREAQRARERQRHSAAGQHRKKLLSAAGALSDALEAAVRQWDALLAAASKFERQLRPDELRALFGHSGVTSILGTAVAMEIGRLAATGSRQHPFPLAPRATIANGARHGQHIRDIDPLSIVLGARFNLDGAAPRAPTKPWAPTLTGDDAKDAARLPGTVSPDPEENERRYLEMYGRDARAAELEGKPYEPMQGSPDPARLGPDPAAAELLAQINRAAGIDPPAENARGRAAPAPPPPDYVPDDRGLSAHEQMMLRAKREIDAAMAGEPVEPEAEIEE